jgi:hypothetical protein
MTITDTSTDALTAPNVAGQYIRKCSLIVYGTPPVPGGTGVAVPAATSVPSDLPPNPNPTRSTIPAKQSPAADQPGLDLSNLRIQFSVTAMDVDAPPTAVIRVMNLADDTARRIQKEFTGVTLQAGYEGGNFGVIFQGTIIRIRKGRLSNIETFVDIMASNLDVVYNFGVVAHTLEKGANVLDQAKAIETNVNTSDIAKVGSSFQPLQYGVLPDDFGTGGTLPRGKVLFGMARDKLGDIADGTGCTWSIGPDGKVQIIKLTGYAPGTIVEINSETGMVGVPEATTQGIEVRCLLNPMIKIGGLIKINNGDINTTTNKSALGFPAYGDFQFFANTHDDGVYRVYVVEHKGDTRGPGADWLTSLVCLTVDQSAVGGKGAVLAYG